MTEASEIWTGEATRYDRARPTPPRALLDLVTQLIEEIGFDRLRHAALQYIGS